MDSMSCCGIRLVFTSPPPKDSTLQYKKCVHLALVPRIILSYRIHILKLQSNWVAKFFFAFYIISPKKTYLHATRGLSFLFRKLFDWVGYLSLLNKNCVKKQIRKSFISEFWDVLLFHFPFSFVKIVKLTKHLLKIIVHKATKKMSHIFYPRAEES